MKVAYPNTETPELIVYRTLPNNIYNTIKEYSGYYTTPNAEWVSKMADMCLHTVARLKRVLALFFQVKKSTIYF